MEHLTQTYLEIAGFGLSWSKDHGYKAQYTKYDKDIKKAIILVSKDSFFGESSDDETFEVWFWENISDRDAIEFDSGKTISTVDELESILCYLER